MKKLTIKALILSLLVLSAPNTKCTPPVAAALGAALYGAIVFGGIILAVGGAIVGATAVVGYKTVKHCKKQKTQKKKRKKTAKRTKKTKKLIADKKVENKKIDLPGEPLIAT